jgi:Lon protease-like protein
MKDLMKGAVPAPPDDVPLGMLADLVASLLPLDPALKQGLLEESDAAARCDRVLALLEARGGDGPPRPKRAYPPGPSLN